MSKKNFYTMSEAAKVLKVGEPTIKLRIDGGSLKAVNVLGQIMIPQKSILEAKVDKKR